VQAGSATRGAAGLCALALAHTCVAQEKTCNRDACQQLLLRPRPWLLLKHLSQQMMRIIAFQQLHVTGGATAMCFLQTVSLATHLHFQASA
jgi:hypothetical protein